MDHVLFFDVTDEEILGRLVKRRGHREAGPTTIRRRWPSRLKAYRDQTAPVLAYYEAQGLVRRVPAIGAVDEIASRVRAAVGR